LRCGVSRNKQKSKQKKRTKMKNNSVFHCM
jgi:hypothetical protein